MRKRLTDTERKSIKKRTDYLIKHSGLDIIYDTYEDLEFSEIMGTIGGDPLRLRCYEVDGEYKIYEK